MPLCRCYLLSDEIRMKFSEKVDKKEINSLTKANIYNIIKVKIFLKRNGLWYFLTIDQHGYMPLTVY